VVSRLLLRAAVDNSQGSWVNLGADICRDVLRGGVRVKGIGGALMEQAISRITESLSGWLKTMSDQADLVAPTGRSGSAPLCTARRRPKRMAAEAASYGVCASVRGPRATLSAAGTARCSMSCPAADGAVR
jgi:FO synthase